MMADWFVDKSDLIVWSANVISQSSKKTKNKQKKPNNKSSYRHSAAMIYNQICFHNAFQHGYFKANLIHVFYPYMMQLYETFFKMLKVNVQIQYSHNNPA